MKKIGFVLLEKSSQEFWQMTIPELMQEYIGYLHRKEKRSKKERTYIWHIAALQRCKRMPKLKKFNGQHRVRYLSEEEEKERQKEHEEIVKKLGGNN